MAAPERAEDPLHMGYAQRGPNARVRGVLGDEEEKCVARTPPISVSHGVTENLSAQKYRFLRARNMSVS